MSSGSGSSSRRSPPRGLSPTPTTSRTAAAVAGAQPDSHLHGRDRSRSRSPHLATPSGSDATANYSVAAHAAALNDAHHAGTSGDGTPQDTKSNLKFSHILIKHKDSRRPVDNEDKPVTRTKDQAMDLVIDIHEKISRDLITFADAAVAFSDCTSARHEGNIHSRFKRGRMQKSFQSAALALGPGKISDIIETNSGYHIIQRAQAGAAGESRRHKRHRTRSRSPRLATPSDGDAASTEPKTRHPTSRDAVARDGARRDAVARGGASRYAVTRDGAGRDAVTRDAMALAGAGRDAVARDGSGHDAVPRESAGRDTVAQDTAERDATPCDGDGASGDRASGDGASGNGTPNDATPQDAKSNFKFSHILIKHKDSRKPVDIEDKPVTRTKEQAMDLVIDIHEKISEHLITFADAAVSFSDCASARNDGDIQSQFKSGRVQKSFEAIALALTPGQISHIIESNSGYHILQRRE